ncbi:hypothetical protein AX17_007281, partial [Amanita inopinata Kibby_2008]
PEPLLSATQDHELSPSELVDYLSKHSTEDSGSDADDEGDNSWPSGHLAAVPVFKRRKLDVSARKTRAQEYEKRQKEIEKGLTDIQKLIHSKKTQFVAGPTGLQAYRACVVESYLLMVMKQGCLGIEASERAAESHGFAAKWGGRSLRGWTRK